MIDTEKVFSILKSVLIITSILIGLAIYYWLTSLPFQTIFGGHP